MARWMGVLVPGSRGPRRGGSKMLRSAGVNAVMGLHPIYATVRASRARDAVSAWAAENSERSASAERTDGVVRVIGPLDLDTGRGARREPGSGDKEKCRGLAREGEVSRGRGSSAGSKEGCHGKRLQKLTNSNLELRGCGLGQATWGSGSSFRANWGGSEGLWGLRTEL